MDYLKMERPVEPAFADEDPEQWVAVLAWTEAHLDAANEQIANLKRQLAHAKADGVREFASTLNQQEPDYAHVDQTVFMAEVFANQLEDK